MKCTVLFLTSGQFVRMRRPSILLVSAFMLVRTTIPCVPVFCLTVVWCLAAFVRQRRARQVAVSVASTTLMISIPSIAFGAARDAGALPLLGVGGKWKSKHQGDRRHGGNEAVTHWRPLQLVHVKRSKDSSANANGQQRGSAAAAIPSLRCMRREAVFPSRDDRLQDNRQRNGGGRVGNYSAALFARTASARNGGFREANDRGLFRSADPTVPAS